MEQQIENLLVLELCKVNTYKKEKIEAWMEQPLNYPYILGHLLYNRLGGAAYYIFSQCGLLGRLNREFRNTLKTVYDSNCEKNQSFLKGLAYLSGLLESVPFPYALLKGAFLVSIYQPGVRTSNDYDILIAQENITVLSDLLKQNGYRQGNVRDGMFVPASRTEILSSRMNRGETVPFIKELGFPQMRYSEVDINFSLDFKAKQEHSVIPEMLLRSEKAIQTNVGSAYTLNKADFLIHLCTHLYKEATTINWVRMGRDVSLYKYMDIYLFVRSFLDNALAQELTDRIKLYHLEKECYYAFAYTKELFDLRCDAFDLVQEGIKPHNTAYLSQIISPADGKIFAFDLPYIQWIFCSDRGGHLNEITDATACL